MLLSGYWVGLCRFVSVPGSPTRAIRSLLLPPLAVALFLFVGCGGGEEAIDGSPASTDEAIGGASSTIQEFPAGSITSAEAIDHIGSNATVCGAVHRTIYLIKSGGGNPTLVELDSIFPDELFVVQIFSRNRHNFAEPPEALYQDRSICATGLIEAATRHGPSTIGAPVMDVTAPDEIQILR